MNLYVWLYCVYSILIFAFITSSKKRATLILAVSILSGSLLLVKLVNNLRDKEHDPLGLVVNCLVMSSSCVTYLYLRALANDDKRNLCKWVKWADTEFEGNRLFKGVYKDDEDSSREISGSYTYSQVITYKQLEPTITFYILEIVN
jgi:hypothetical protein